MIRIVIYGDFAPIGRISTMAKDGHVENALSEVRDVNEAYDYCIVNLECPILPFDNKPIEKSGPCLKCKEYAIEMLKFAKTNCVTLANNHFRDYGDYGVKSTLEMLNNNSIDYVGGGNDIIEASRTLFKVIHGKTIAIINCTENEFSIATVTRGGSNPINPIKQFYAIKEARDKADYVIIIVHGGVELYNLPTPRMQECYRFFIDAGADAVVNHHQHCYSGYEIYHEHPIFYGLGNFCFDNAKFKNHIWNKGYAVMLSLDENTIDFQLMPYLQCNDKPTIHFLDAQSKKEFEKDIANLNTAIAQPDVLNDSQIQYFEKYNLNSTLLTPYSTRLTRGLCRKGWLPNYFPKSNLIILLNRIRCESHRERLIHYLEKRLNF